MASLHSEPKSLDERVRVLEAELALVRHDLANLRMMAQYTYDLVEIIEDMLSK